jgi:hypothetical protein
MSHGRVITALGLIALLAAPSIADAQSRQRGNRGGGNERRAVPRGNASRDNGPRSRVAPRRAMPRPPSYRGSYGYRNYRYPAYGYRNYGYRNYPYRTFGYRAYGWAYPGYYRPSLGLNLYFGSLGYYGRPYGYAYPGPGYGYPGYAFPAYGAPGYGVGVQVYGGLRIDIPERDAEVYVDGYYAGIVDDFDGSFQQANLEPGPHRIEVRAEGYESMVFDVNILPNRTTTYRGNLRPLLP